MAKEQRMQSCSKAEQEEFFRQVETEKSSVIRVQQQLEGMAEIPATQPQIELGSPHNSRFPGVGPVPVESGQGSPYDPRMEDIQTPRSTTLPPFSQIEDMGGRMSQPIVLEKVELSQTPRE